MEWPVPILKGEEFMCQACGEMPQYYEYPGMPAEAVREIRYLQQKIKYLEESCGFRPQDPRRQCDIVFSEARYQAALVTKVQEIIKEDENHKESMQTWRKILEVLMYPEVSLGLRNPRSNNAYYGDKYLSKIPLMPLSKT